MEKALPGTTAANELPGTAEAKTNSSVQIVAFALFICGGCYLQKAILAVSLKPNVPGVLDKKLPFFSVPDFPPMHRQVLECDVLNRMRCIEA